MNFKDVTRWIAIGALTLDTVMTLWKITKLNKENPYLRCLQRNFNSKNSNIHFSYSGVS